jgi:hypothetical protein
MDEKNTEIPYKLGIESFHLKTLSIIYYSTSALALLWIGLIYRYYLSYSIMISKPTFRQEFAQNSPAFPVEIVLAYKWLYLASGLLVVIAGIINFSTAKYIENRKNRNSILLAASMNCLVIPFGTILGAATIYVLLRDDVKIQFTESGLIK